MSTLASPLRWEPTGRMAEVDGDLADMLTIANVIGTRCSMIGEDGRYIPGELPWNPDFGSRVPYLQHASMPEQTVRDLARSYSVDALRRWCPNLRVTRLTADVETQVDQSNKLTIHVWYLPVGAPQGQTPLYAKVAL